MKVTQYLEGGLYAGGWPSDFLSDVVAEDCLGGDSAGVDVGEEEEEGGSGGGPRPPPSAFRSVTKALVGGALASEKI